MRKLFFQRGTLQFEEKRRHFGKPCPKSRRKYQHLSKYDENSSDIADSCDTASENSINISDIADENLSDIADSCDIADKNSSDITDSTSIIVLNAQTEDSVTESVITNARASDNEYAVENCHSRQSSVAESDYSKDLNDDSAQNDAIREDSENVVKGKMPSTVSDTSVIESGENLEILGPEVVTTSISPEPGNFPYS